MVFLDKIFFEKIRFIFDIQNWLWKYDFGTFWKTVITHSFLKIFPWWHVDSWPKSSLFRTHHFWNSTTELILMYIVLTYWSPSWRFGSRVCWSFSSTRISRGFRCRTRICQILRKVVFVQDWKQSMIVNFLKVIRKLTVKNGLTSTWWTHRHFQRWLNNFDIVYQIVCDVRYCRRFWIIDCLP